MNRIFKELPIVFPFYELKGNQNRYRENIEGLHQFNLISPSDALLPFQIEMPSNKPAPLKWEIIGAHDNNVLDITNNLPAVSIYKFTEKQQAVYFGTALQFVYETIDQPLDLPCGEYYTVFTFADDTQYVSEVFTVPENSFKAGAPNDFIQIDFYNDFDISPILYRDNFQQSIYLNTFVHSFDPEIDEEVEKDGFLNEIPVFQKLILRYKIADIVPDFIKIALISLQMHDKINIITKQRSGEIKRLQVTAQPQEGGGSNDIEITFEDEMLYKGNCSETTPATSVETW